MKQKYFSETRNVPVIEQHDIIVTGGGIGGVAAALAAARQGASVLLLEKQAMLGGLATSGLVNWYEPMCDGRGKLLVTGIAYELMQLAIRDGYDDLPSAWRDRKTTAPPEQKRCATVFSPTTFALALNQLLWQASVTVRYDILACRPVMQGNACQGVITESKSGRQAYACSMLIDASGDADMLHRAGMPCRTGENYMTYYGHGCNEESLQAALDTQDFAKLNSPGFFHGSNLNGKGHPEGMKLFQGVTHEEISDYLIKGQLGLLEKLQRSSQPGCLTALPGMAQLRKTRCLIGAETFRSQTGQSAANSIGATGDFRRRGPRYELPAGILHHPDHPNLLAAGRTVSAQGDGWEITRVIPTAAMTGQAAGTLAALAHQERCEVQGIKIGRLQDALSQAGVTLKANA